jgi:hypothetical protein
MRTIDLVTLAELYAAHRGLALSTISTYAANDGKYFGNLKKGSGCTLSRAVRLLAWFDANWGPDLEWPRHISRPSKSRKDAA